MVEAFLRTDVPGVENDELVRAGLQKLAASEIKHSAPIQSHGSALRCIERVLIEEANGMREKEYLTRLTSSDERSSM